MTQAIPAFPITDFDVGSGAIRPNEAMMNTGHVPVTTYTDHERFEMEAEMFGHIWLNIADESDVGTSGDWIVRSVACRDTSILITRDGAGKLRAFHNVCTHRGMQLVWGEKGNSHRFSCPYHAWTFAADGALKVVPDEGGFPCLDKERSVLRPIHLGVWEGYIFINLDREPAQTLEQFLAPISRRFRDLPLKRFTHHASMGARLNCNWKLLLEAQSESYHIRALHARTVSGMMSYSDNPFCHPLYWESLGQHRTWSTGINPNFELSDSRPAQKFAFTASAQIISTAQGTGVADAPPSGFRGPETIDRGDPSIWASDNIVLFPHVQLNAGANGCWMHRFWPVSENGTDWEARYYFSPPSSFRQAFAQHYTTAFNRDTLIEDNNACSRQQTALKSGAVDFIQFGAQEMACRHNAAVVQAAIDNRASWLRAAE